MASLKSQLVSVLNTISAFVGFPAKYVLGLAAWAIEKYVPDDAAGHDPAEGGMRAAPQDVRTVVLALFDRAIAFIPSGIGRRMAEQAAKIVVDNFLDAAWDAVLARLGRDSATPVGASQESADAASAAATAFLEGV